MYGTVQFVDLASYIDFGYFEYFTHTHTHRFLDACSLANLMQFNSQGEPGEPPPSNLIKITVTKDDCHVTAGGQITT